MLDIYFVQCYLQNYGEMLPKFLIFPSADGISRSKSTETGRETSVPAWDAVVTVHTKFLNFFKFGRNFPGNSSGFQSRIVPGTGNFSGFRRIPDEKWNPGLATSFAFLGPCPRVHLRLLGLIKATAAVLFLMDLIYESTYMHAPSQPRDLMHQVGFSPQKYRKQNLS